MSSIELFESRPFLERYPMFLELYERASLDPCFDKKGLAFTALWIIFNPKNKVSNILRPKRVRKILRKYLRVKVDQPHSVVKDFLAEVIEINLFLLYKQKNE